MKYTDLEWALINKHTGDLYRLPDGNKVTITFTSREAARNEKRNIYNSEDYLVERVKVTYERVS